MEIINFITVLSVPIIILSVLVIGTKEKKNVFDLFCDGVIEGLKIILNIFPTLLRFVFCNKFA